MAKLKVYGGWGLNKQGVQVRTIVASTSQKKAAELAGITMSHFRGFWCETANEHELAVALSKPETVFQACGNSPSDKRFAAVEQPL